MAAKGKHEQSPREQWRALPKWQRTGTLILAPIEIVATTIAVVDLIRRPREQIRGPKFLWWPAPHRPAFRPVRLPDPGPPPTPLTAPSHGDRGT